MLMLKESVAALAIFFGYPCVNGLFALMKDHTPATAVQDSRRLRKWVGMRVIDHATLHVYVANANADDIGSGLVFTLMEDLVETSTKKDCSAVFAYLEGQSAMLLKPRAQTSGRLILLRICNALLRRLSKSHDAVLCGCVPPWCFVYS